MNIAITYQEESLFINIQFTILVGKQTEWGHQ